MKTIYYYQNQVLKANLGQCKKERLLRVINYLHKKGIMPEVEELSKLSQDELILSRFLLHYEE